jgi:hypothetical protein
VVAGSARGQDSEDEEFHHMEASRQHEPGAWYEVTRDFDEDWKDDNPEWQTYASEELPGSTSMPGSMGHDVQLVSESESDPADQGLCSMPPCRLKGIPEMVGPSCMECGAGGCHLCEPKVLLTDKVLCLACSSLISHGNRGNGNRIVDEELDQDAWVPAARTDTDSSASSDTSAVSSPGGHSSASDSDQEVAVAEEVVSGHSFTARAPSKMASDTLVENVKSQMLHFLHDLDPAKLACGRPFSSTYRELRVFPSFERPRCSNCFGE